MEHLCGQYFLNSDLRADEIREQIREFHRAGYETIFLHARAGLKTPYFSQDWFDALEIAVDELAACNMKFAIWDEDNYPSGDAGNRICNSYPEFAGQHLNFMVIPAQKDQKALEYFSVNGAFLGCYAVYPDGTISDISCRCGTLRSKWGKSWVQSSAYSPFAQLPYPHRRRSMDTPRFAVSWTPDRDCRIVCAEIIRSAPGLHSSDLMNREMTEKLIELTHAEYEKRFKDKMQNCSASFMDEPSPAWEYPWTRRFPEEFKRDHGYDLLENLPHLVMDISAGSLRVRTDYRQTMHRLLCQNYLKPVKDWLNARNIASTGHLSRSEYVAYSGKMWPNQLRCFKYLDIPCCDPLGAGVGEFGSAAHHLGTKIVASAARLFGKSAAGADAFAVGGDTIALRDLKFMLDYHLTMGLNWYNVHGLYYTLDGERRDEAPPSLFYQHSQWRHMGTFLDYLKKRCAELSGEHICHLEMLYPSSALMCRLTDAPDPSEALHRTAEELLSHQLDFELIDEKTLIEHDPAEFVRSRPYFLVAHASVIGAAAANWLERYAAAGGTLLVTGVIPQILPEHDAEAAEKWTFAETCFCQDYCSRIYAPELTGENAEKVLIRQIRKDGQIRTYLFNRGTQRFCGTFDGCAVEIAPGAAGFADELRPAEKVEKLNISAWKLTFGLNSVPLNYWEHSWVEAFDLLTRNNPGLSAVPECGEFNAVFTVDSPLDKVFFTTGEEDLAKVEFSLNGTSLKDFRKADFRDCRELETEVTSLIRPGRNILSCKGELIGNAPYLRGRFKVHFPCGNYGYPVLSSAPEVFEFTTPGDFRSFGYGTFSGTAVYEGRTEVREKGIYALELNLVKDSVSVFIDGEKRGTLIAPPYRIETELDAGSHEIRLELCNAPGNRDIMAGVPAGLQR